MNISQTSENRQKALDDLFFRVLEQQNRNDLMGKTPGEMTAEELARLPQVIAEHQAQAAQDALATRGDSETQIRSDFAVALIATLPAHLKPSGRKLFDYAWSEAHSEGYHSVELIFTEIARIFT